ncbi:MAG: hypothetical protein ACI4SX_01165 [Candidatus Fimenecus sp.]
MSYIINSIPLWIRVSTLAICEIIMVYMLAKGKLKSSAPPGVMLIKLFIIFAPIYIVIMLYNQYCESNAIPTPSFDWTMVFMIAFVVGLWAVALYNVVKGNFNEQQKRTIIICFVLFLICFLSVAVIEVLEKLGLM